MAIKSVLFLRSNPVAPDPRVAKEAQALADAGYKVGVVAWDRTGELPKVEETPFGLVERLPIKGSFGSGLANLLPLVRFNLALLWHLIKRRSTYDAIHACDFDTVLPALVAAKLLGKKVVYDVFDFYADMLRATPGWIKSIIKKVDLRLMGWVDAVILADESRVKQIQGARPKRLTFIYNSPPIEDPFPLPPAPPPLRIAYVGLLQKERGILQVIELLRRHPEWELDLGGFGGDEEEIRRAVADLPNVRYYGRVPYEKALELMSNAHLLFATYDPSIPNHRYSSANKLFEAMAIGRPIVVARDTGMDQLVQQYALGFVVEYGNLAALEDAFARVASWDLQRFEEFSQKAQEVYVTRFAWRIMKERLIALYRKLEE
ncbi:glycosyltransferase family 4 protein [Thermus thermophilus]|uniref:glycosyltransferase family 4 protein n=1 Tax=Thermus thermophilus TaxID=274 RepID=UPI001FCBB88F|nr:glycosyltransferase family 4 protein [Thermus thermophilus]BDG23491.1 glycosyl transferase [Thermus thermophilus]